MYDGQENVELIAKITRGLSDARSRRSTFEQHWDDVAKLTLPHLQYTFNLDNTNTPGQEYGKEMFDTTAAIALGRFAAAMNSSLTPMGARWHSIRIADPVLNARRDVRLWCDKVTDIMFHYRYAAAANYSSQQYEGYVNQGAFGTSGMLITAPREKGVKGLRYKNVHLGELFVAENYEGVVDKVWRRYKTSLRNVIATWPDALVDLKDSLEDKLNKNPEEKVWVVHHICPRDNWSERPVTGKAMRYASYYVLEAESYLLEEGGFRTFPLPVSRMSPAPGEMYGRGPAMQVLPSIKGLNAQRKTILKQAHRAVDPVLLAHDDGILEGVNLMPGAVNYGAVSAEGRRLVDILPTGNINIGVDTMQDERQSINDAFFVTLFQILVDQPQMTATEVLERAREKGALLAPSFGRYQTEGLGRQIQREYEVLLSQKLIPKPPQALIEANPTWEVEFDAPLNRQIKAEAAAGFQRTIQFATEIANVTQDPSIFDVFDMDIALRDIAQSTAVPEKYLVDDATIQAKRAGRQQAQSQQQLVDAAPAIASTLKAVGAGQVTGG